MIAKLSLCEYSHRHQINVLRSRYRLRKMHSRNFPPLLCHRDGVAGNIRTEASMQRRKLRYTLRRRTSNCNQARGVGITKINSQREVTADQANCAIRAQQDTQTDAPVPKRNEAKAAPGVKVMPTTNSLSISGCATRHLLCANNSYG